jgi:S1-C subfamily serine protease
MWPLNMAARLGSFALIVAVLLSSSAASAQNGGVSGWELNYSSDVAAQILKPSVVFIETRFDRPRNDTEYAIWSYFRGARPLYGLYGSGFIYKDPKYVITTPFLLTHAEYIRVITSDGEAFPAKLVDDDDVFKTAVLEVDWGHHYEPVPALLANSDELKLGEPITILGYDTEGVDYVSTVGVISAIRKELPSVEEPTEQYIQFDAAYELPMMGGPLANVRGEVVGIVYGTVTDFYQSNINLAVPVNDLVRVADRIISGEAKKPWFGVETLWVTDQIRLLNKIPERIENGVFITYVEPGSPADLAGLQPGDVITALNGNVFVYYFDYKAFMRRVSIGQVVEATYWRFTPGVTDAAGTVDQDIFETVVQILEHPEEEEEG